MKEAIEILERKNVKPTANRILVIKALLHSEHPVGLVDLETEIGTMDRSSIFRALNVFLAHDIVHGIEDGSGSLKYELCHGENNCSISDMHVHFYCEGCHTTYCFESTPIPEVNVPDGFSPHSINYMIKGLCAKCSSKASYR